MLPAPTNPKANAAYRRAILKRAATDKEFQRECWVRASRDFFWWCNTFAWTYDPKSHPSCPNRPFVLYEYQMVAAGKVFSASGRHWAMPAAGYQASNRCAVHSLKLK